MATGDYCTLAQVKAYIGTDQTVAATDDLLEDLITDASRRIDDYCQRQFYGVVQVRYFDAVEDVDKRTLLLDEDLCEIISVTNGDGTTLDSTDYVLYPLNETPKNRIVLKAASGKAWEWETDPEAAIQVNGTWGYSVTAPTPVERAAVRLTYWLFKQRFAPFGLQGVPETGFVEVPASFPDDIKALLNRGYVRHRIGAI